MDFSSLFLLIGAAVVLGGDDVFGENSIGCLFSEDVCDNNEWCYDDNVFGRCLSENEPNDETNFYRYSLERDILEKLEHEMKRLFQQGYHWSHAYTQCILQNLLYSYRFDFEYNPSVCNDVAGLDQHMDFLSTDPQDLAIIQFNPSYLDRNTDYAYEWFLPPLYHDPSRGPNYFGSAKKYPSDSDHIRKKKVEDFSNEQLQLTNEELEILLHLLKSDLMSKNSVKERTNDDLTKELPSYQLYNNDVRHDSFENPEPVSTNDANEDHPILPNEETSNFLSSDEFIGDEFEKPENSEEEESFLDDGRFESDFYNDNTFRDGGFKRLHRYDVKKPGPNFMNNLDDFDSTEAVVKEQLHQVYLYKLLEQMLQQKQNESGEDQEFTAEGMVNSQTNENSEDINKGSELRPNENNKENVLSDTSKRMNTEKIPQNLSLRNINNGIQLSQAQTEESSQKPTNYDIVDASYAYMNVDKDFSNWKEGAEFVRALESLLQLPDGSFTNIRVEKNQVTFKVNLNSGELNASTVASKAESLTTELKEKTGRTLVSAGIGDQVKVSLLSLETDKKLFIVTFVVCGCIAGILIAVAVIYVVRRHARTREKLQSLSQPETEPSHDYQDLCRQRMANKNNEKPEPIHAAQRITSLSRESETSVRSPSSRSSTSSWSEEPVVSNMDISTGHMVLSYMEDHLKNKDRLDQEWVALCAYEAEPCSIIAATQSSNFKKNRYPDVLPYDHSRVVLNDLTNIAGSDYINASTITDHDPRNPAYIATQGPLPHTAADFWQMVWEQGSVVIVMLTRLIENGVAMCHRYWPEEGSELYHIYEVHLVSEHIWCDDYLVRSFYLKNLKTGETRTVTQFHFLSWPENSVPSSVKAMLDFRRKVNKSYRGRSCPIVVHCSDGSGRTGTYCLIDMVLNRMAKGAKEIDIAATLEHIRDQRPLMVKTKSQFEFALTSVAEEVHAILKALPQ